MSVKLIVDPPDETVIAAIERLLEEAKSGEIQSIAYAISYKGRYTSSGWAGMNKNDMSMVGEISVLKRDVMDVLIQLRVDPQTGDSIWLIKPVAIDKSRVLELINKNHGEGIPNWTTAEMQEAMEIMKELGYLWFRSEDFKCL